MTEKQLHLRLCKIYNWGNAGQEAQIQFDFYSKESQYLITQKQVKSKCISSDIELDIKLKVKYPPNEKIVLLFLRQIVISIRQLEPKQQNFGDLFLNLDDLYENKIKFLSFGSYQKILQIQGGSKDDIRQIKNVNLKEPALLGGSIQEKRIRNKIFIEQRKKFLKNYVEQQKQLKSGFSQKIGGLLREESPQRITIRTPKFQKRRQEESFDYDFQKDVVKSQISKRNRNDQFQTKSQFYGTAPEHSFVPTYLNPQKKHKLILNTLNIVTKEDQ